MLSDERLARMQERHEAIRYWDPRRVWCVNSRRPRCVLLPGNEYAYPETVCETECSEVARFIAHAYVDVPALLDEIGRLKKLLKEAG